MRKPLHVSPCSPAPPSMLGPPTVVTPRRLVAEQRVAAEGLRLFPAIIFPSAPALAQSPMVPASDTEL